ncbi:hypothetical protein [Saccharospirillum impatiens]|uniref:hypothetical protein n=1 Tax=Saccharospirillum impatiens TaxID=169438 RepID=UPI0003FAB2BB|nr:hypothetical protein [Saccharospirillum impatiens]
MIDFNPVKTAAALMLAMPVTLPVWSSGVNQGDRVQGMALFMNESAENIQWLWLGGIAIGALVFLLFVRWIHYAMIRRHKPKTKVPVNKDYRADPSSKKKSAPTRPEKPAPQRPKQPAGRKRRY